MTKIHIVVSDDSYIYEAISENIQNLELYSLIHVKHDWEEYVKDISKIDLLIFDTQISKDCLQPGIIPYYKIKNLVNLTDAVLSPDEIKFLKPFKLTAILEIIERNWYEEYMFCSINKEMIYDERLNILKFPDSDIQFTEKENEIFRLLLVSQTNGIDKEYLRDKVWHYHQDSITTTIDTHIYKLKQKLPEGWLEIKNNNYFLNIQNLVL